MTQAQPALQLLGTQLGKHVFRVAGLPDGVHPEVAEVTVLGARRPERVDAAFFAGRHRPQPGGVFLVTSPPPGCLTFFHVRAEGGIDAILLLDPAAGLVPVG